MRLWGSIPCLLMPWLLKSPERQQAWYWLCKTDHIYNCSRANFTYLSETKSKKWFKTWIHLLQTLKQFSMIRLKNESLRSNSISYIRMSLCISFPDLKKDMEDSKAWISNYNHIKLWDVITHPCPKFNSSLAKEPLKLGHGWVIKPYSYGYDYLSMPSSQ